MMYLSTSNAYMRDPCQPTFRSWVMGREKTHHAARQASGHESEADEEKETCAPDCARVTEAIFSADAVLVD